MEPRERVPCTCALCRSPGPRPNWREALFFVLPAMIIGWAALLSPLFFAGE